MYLTKFSKKEFGLRLKECRVEHAGMTQEELAKASGISAMHISHFECGRRTPNLENFAKLVVALETNCENLLQIELE